MSMDNSDVKNIQRQNNPKRDSNVDDEVQKLLRKGDKLSQQDLIALRNKFGNEELVEKIEKAYLEKFTEINKRAKKFAKLIREKYADAKYPFHILLEKAYKYKQKYGLSDAEFTEFQRKYETELVGLKSPDVFQPNTNIMKLLGKVNVNLHGFNSKLNENDYKILQEILKLHATSKPLHSQVLLQSMQYQDLAVEAVTGTYDRNSHNVANHIHPVIAALFFPKINYVDTHFLHSNISNIVKTRYNNESFTSVADMQLYYCLSTDPNDIVCDSRSTIADLYNRALLQNQLWNSVIALRNGQYYNNSFREFINSVDICRLNKYDNPDLIYGRNDGTILKRLLSAFSFRPTVVATTPMYALFNTNPYQQNVTPLVTYVHMINLKLPATYNDNTPIPLQDSLQQNQLFIENGDIIPKHTSLIYSRGVLIFYVDRRANIIHLPDSMNPFNMGKLPLAAAGYERLNDREVHFEDEIKIRDDLYKLRSVVISEINKTPEHFDKKLVVGSATLLLKGRDDITGQDRYCYLYNPYSVVLPSTDINIPKNLPVVQVNYNNGSDPECTFQEMARKRGIIFIYQLDEERKDVQIAY
jgi:hypothetical protein